MPTRQSNSSLAQIPPESADTARLRSLPQSSPLLRKPSASETAPLLGSDLLDVWNVLAVAPAVEQLARIRWHRKVDQGRALVRARPVSRLHLTYHEIRGAHRDKIPLTEGTSSPSHSVASSLE